MTTRELMRALAEQNPDDLVVLDVNAEDCISDRNIFDITSVAALHPETRSVALQASPLSRKSEIHMGH